VRVVVPYAAGGGTDFFARLVFGAMGEQLGQQFVIENKPGAGTNIGADAAARAEPDGYTLLLGDTATFATNRTLYRKLSFDPYKDFTPVSLTGRFALVLLVNTNKLPVKSVQELVAEAKKNPGRINYATPGLGSPFHLATELLSQAAGIKLTHVPYRGAAPAVQDLVAGQVDMMFIDFATARSRPLRLHRRRNFRGFPACRRWRPIIRDSRPGPGRGSSRRRTPRPTSSPSSTTPIAASSAMWRSATS
jgi:tripartite-type tricarboxylate transporter receptor subunit TctC